VFGEGTGPIHLEYPNCGGGEFRLIDCDYNRDVSQTRYSHSNDWGVFCSIDGQDPWDIRLNGGSNGQLQVYLSEQWQPVANSYSTWTSNNSRVVCRELGFDPYHTDSSSFYGHNTYSPSPPVTTIDDVTCSGDESSLQSCVHLSTLLSSYPTVGVECLGVACGYGDMRLADGGTEAEGRVEVCIDNRWGTVCDNRWNENSTAVACKHLGFSEIVNESRYFSSDKFGKGSGPVLIDYINCTGLEGNLLRCNHFTHASGCSHDSDVGVTCMPARCSDGKLRLTDGSGVTGGRVEICSHQRWNTFNSSTWFATNGKVACIELGFRGYNRLTSSFGGGGGPRFNQYFRCTGSEARLSECQSFNLTPSGSSGYDVGIYCSLASCTDGELRLMEGGSDFEGRVEMCLSSRWGTIGGNGWTQTNSDVVCNALGYEITNEPANQSTPVAPSKPLHYHSIRCTRRDLTLLDCGFKKSSPYDYAEIERRAIVKCKEPACGDGDLRLVGGNTKEEGRLEVCFGNRWGTINGERWTHTDTEVACKQLGYSTSDVSYSITERQRHLLSQSLPTFMTVVGCYGSEERVVDCDYQDFRYSSSTSSPTTTMDVSISCGSSEESSAQASSVAMASLSISVILAVAVIALVAVLIALLVLQRRRKRRDKDLPHHSTHDPNTGGRYSSSGIAFSSKTETVAMDNKMAMEDLPAESYEEMDTLNRYPVPPKPQSKRPPNRAKAAPRKVDSTRYARGGNSRPTAGPKPQHHVQSRGQPRQPSPPSDFPEAIYECPDPPDEDY
jgi:deleted-in-malignant-brain-tumors protein 1